MLKRYGVGSGESDLGADFNSFFAKVTEICPQLTILQAWGEAALSARD
jgi:hypothetical protein